MGAQEHHLVFPCVCTQRPAMAEENGLASAPVFVIDLGTVLGGKCAHGGNSSIVELSRTPAPGSAIWHESGGLLQESLAFLGRPEFVQVVFQSVIEPASIREVAAHIAHMAAKA